MSDSLETEQPVDLDGAGLANSRHLVTGVVEGNLSTYIKIKVENPMRIFPS